MAKVKDGRVCTVFTGLGAPFAVINWLLVPRQAWKVVVVYGEFWKRSCLVVLTSFDP